MPSREEIAQIQEHPVYADFPTMLKMWDLGVPYASEWWLGKNLRGLPARLAGWFTSSLKGLQEAKPEIMRIEAGDTIQRQDFLVLKVVTLHRMKDVRVSDLKKHFELVMLPTDPGFYRQRQQRLTIMM